MPRALLVVDAQRDFVEGGALPVSGGAEVCVAIANAIRSHGQGMSCSRYQYILATKDFHLPGSDNGGHFSDNPDYITNWPEHCVQGTEGAMLHPAVADVGFTNFDAVFYKGQGRPDYSGFQGKAPHMYGETYLLEWLQHTGVKQLEIVGLATDYCVFATAMDAIENGFYVNVPQKLTAAVGGPEARDAAIRKIREAQGLDPDHIW